jgi:cytochrome c-type biogenesis protein CcmH/NrfG
MFAVLNFSLGGIGRTDNMCHLGGFITGLMLGLPLGAFARKSGILQIAILVITAAVLAAGYRELQQTKGADAQKTAAVLAWQLRDYAKAARLMEKYTVARPEDADGLVFLGEAYANNHQPDKAIAALEQALRVNPNSEDAKQDLEQLRSRSLPSDQK